MTLKDSIESDAASVFLSSDEFAESVTYLPRSGGSRTILAVVDREPPTLLDSAGNVISLSFVVYVHNDATTGISSSEVNTGGDKVQLHAKLGDAAVRTVSIVQMIDNDFGMVQLGLK